MPSLVRGRIVYPKIAIPDPQGHNPKSGRPFVVISRDEEIQKGDRIQAIGITGELTQSPPDHYIPIPYGPTAKSGLKQKSAALCTWLIDIACTDVDSGKGYVRPDVVNAIVTKVIELKAIPVNIGHADQAN